MLISRLIFLFLFHYYFAQIINNNSMLIFLIQHLNVHHVHLLKSDNEAQNEEFINFQKSLWDLMPWLYISIVSTSNIISMIESASDKSFKSSVILIERNESVIDMLDFITITKNFDISKLKWILLTNNYKEDDYKTLKIPYNCEFIIANGSEETGYEIHELYDILDVTKIKNFLGKWSSSEGLKMTDLEIGKRRGNLQGATFNITANQRNPCSIQSFESSAGSVLMCIQFHLFSLFGQKNNFSINWIPQNAGALGSTFQPEYLSDTIQFTIFEVNSNPIEGITVIWPTTSTPIAVYTSYAGRALGWSTFIYPFSKEMWLAVVVWFVLSAAVISTAEYVTLSGMGKRFWFKLWMRYIFLAYSAFCFQDEGVVREWISVRILLFLIFLIPTALMPGYSAALTSYLAVKNEKAPFTNLEGLSKAKEYKLGHVKSFNLSVFLDRNSEDEVVRTLYKDILIPLEEMPVTESDGLQRMCNEKFSYLCTVFTVMAVPPKCSFYSLDRPLFIARSMMPVKSNNPYKNLISRSMRDFVFSGIFLMESLRVLPVTVTNPTVEAESPEMEPIEFENIITIIAFLGIGTFFAILTLLLEYVFIRRSPSDFTHNIMLPF